MAGPVTLTICTTCRAGLPDLPDIERPGARLAATIAASDLPEGVRIAEVQCLSACSRGCTVALTGGAARWSYVYGDIDPDTDAAEVLRGAGLYAATEDGLVPWRERPEIFRKHSVARIPPQEPK